MLSFDEGSVVIVDTGQAGTLIEKSKKDGLVLLRNGDIWQGPLRGIRLPQDQADLDACPIEVERLEPKRALIDRNTD